MGTLAYTKWSGKYGGVSRWYNRTAITEEVKGNEPISLIDRRVMQYVHRTKLRHFQLGRVYQEKSRSTEVKLSEGAFLRRRWMRRVQKSFIAYMQYETKNVLEDQAKLVNEYGQAAVNRALGDPVHETEAQKTRKMEAIRRKVRSLPAVPAVPRHVATMKQIHNDRFNMRWRQN
jgi:hypothetical protein